MTRGWCLPGDQREQGGVFEATRTGRDRKGWSMDTTLRLQFWDAIAQ